LLGLIYLGVFHVWMHVGRPAIIFSALAASFISVVFFVRAESQGYFINHWDRAFHASVILDIFLEGLLIPSHENHGFYLCALGFAVVLGGYRGHKLKQVRAPKTPA